MSFRIVPLPAAVADRAREVPPVEADEHPGFPCRICLRDAAVGERVRLFGYAPFEKDGPYRTSGPIFVHAEPCERYAGGEVPEMLRVRLLSLRAYDAEERMVTADVTEGTGLEAAAARLFADARVTAVHVHLARAGC